MKHITRFSAVILCILLFSQFNVSAAEKRHVINSANDDISFSLKVEDCTDNENNGKIKCTLNLVVEDRGYYISLNGGKSFRKITDNQITVGNLKPGTYSVCVKENNTKEAIALAYNVYVAEEKSSSPVKFHVVSSAGEKYDDSKIRINIDNYSASEKYEYSINGGKSWNKMNDRSIIVKKLKEDSYKVAVRNEKETSSTITLKVIRNENGNSKYIKTDTILQLPELPTGCEITSLTMLLNHIGFDVSKHVLADNYLPKGEYRASNFNKVFVGDPHSTYAYGCYAPVIVKAAKKYLEKYDKNSE